MGMGLSTHQVGHEGFWHTTRHDWQQDAVCRHQVLYLRTHHLAIAKPSHRKFGIRKPADAWFILLYSLLNTTLHYAFFYFGLSHNAGARSAILNSMSVFTVVILACIFFKSDKMTYRKALGCIIGFLGILA